VTHATGPFSWSSWQRRFPACHQLSARQHGDGTSMAGQRHAVAAVERLHADEQHVVHKPVSAIRWTSGRQEPLPAALCVSDRIAGLPSRFAAQSGQPWRIRQ
jgi:hypothetical protein